MFSKNKPKIICEIFFKLKFSIFNQNFSTLDVFGKLFLIVYGICDWDTSLHWHNIRINWAYLLKDTFCSNLLISLQQL